MVQEGKQVRVVLTVSLPAAQKRELVHPALMVNLPKAQKRKLVRRVLWQSPNGSGMNRPV